MTDPLHTYTGAPSKGRCGSITNLSIRENFSADTNPYQCSDKCISVAGQITERPRRLSKTSADAPETERGTQVGGTHEHTSMCA